ncbi:MAG: hypothetical protein MHMPM18_002153 [Marteilia pararefringens]
MMLNAKLLCFVDERLRLACQKEEDFGGIKVILVGDPRQLPAINGKKLWDDLHEGNIESTTSSRGNRAKMSKTASCQESRSHLLYQSYNSYAYLSISERHQGDIDFSSIED